METVQDQDNRTTPSGPTYWLLVFLALTPIINWERAVLIEPALPQPQAVGRRGARRGLVSDGQVVSLMVIAIFSIGFAILPHILPSASDPSPLSIGRILYFLVWITWLWLAAPLAAPLLLPKCESDEKWPLNSVDLMAALAGLFLLCYVTGEFLMVIAAFFGFPEGRWLVKPSTLNAINIGVVVVTFVPIWRQDIWKYTRRFVSVSWIVLFAVSTITYVGAYGHWFQPLDASQWQNFCTYGGFSAVAIFVAFIGFLISAENNRLRRFVLPLGLAGVFTAWVLWRLAAPSGAPVNYSLIIAHAANGALFGLILDLWRRSTRWWGGSHVTL